MDRVKLTGNGARSTSPAERGGMDRASPRQCTDTLLNEVSGRLLRAVRAIWRTHIPAGMSLAQFRTLMFVNNNAGTSLRDVADYFSVSMPTASATVNRLVSQGLVAVSDHVGDKRRIALHATAVGNAIYQDGSGFTEAEFVKTMAKLSRAERVALRGGLDVLVKVIGQLPVPVNGRKRPAGKSAAPKR
jgi:DNA-binding MarR family transcriptional regulator